MILIIIIIVEIVTIAIMIIAELVIILARAAEQLREDQQLSGELGIRRLINPKP